MISTSLINRCKQGDPIEFYLLPNFPEIAGRDDVEGVNPGILYALQNFRTVIGSPICLSIPGTIVAKSGHAAKSRHYIEQGADAIDVFIEDYERVIPALAMYNPFGGVGFYFDTVYAGKPCLMLHFDLRPLRNELPTCWLRMDGHYGSCTTITAAKLLNDHRQDFD